MNDELLMLYGAREAVVQMMQETTYFGRVTDFNTEVVSWEDIYQFLTGLIVEKKEGEKNND